MHDLIAPVRHCHYIGPVVSAENRQTDGNCIACSRRGSAYCLRSIYGYTGPIFAIFSPYESALRANDGSVAYLIFQFVKGRCHGNQIMLP